MLFINVLKLWREKEINHLKKGLSVGKVIVLQVINVDNVKGFIDLSNKNIKPEEVDKCNLRYAKSKQVESIVKLLALRTYKSMETIYKKVIWPLYKTHNHALDALEEVIEKGNLSILNRLNVNDEIKNELMNILKKRWKYIPIKIRADFKLTCFNFDGIEAIKEALLKGEKKSTENIQIKLSIIKAPLYRCILTTMNVEKGFEIMNQVLEVIKTSIEARNGNYLLKVNPSFFGEDEESLSEEAEENEDENENKLGIKAHFLKFVDEEF